MLGVFKERLLRRDRSQRYPARPATPPTAFRGQPELLTDRCRGTAACAAVCPSGALRVERLAEGWSWTLDRSRCVSCGLCLEACPEAAIASGPSFELAALDRASLRLTIEFRQAGPEGA